MLTIHCDYKLGDGHVLLDPLDLLDPESSQRPRRPRHRSRWSGAKLGLGRGTTGEQTTLVKIELVIF